MAYPYPYGFEEQTRRMQDLEYMQQLYPQAAKSDSATKKAELLTTEEHSIKVNALTAGTTNVWVGNKIYDW